MSHFSPPAANLDAPPILVPAHNLARWVHAKLAVRNGVMRWEVPRTILGIIPVGKRVMEVPTSEVLGIRVGRTVRPMGAGAGIALIVLPFLFEWGWWAALTVPIGVWAFLVATGPRIEAKTSRGRTIRANVCFGHKLDADLYIAAVEDIAALTGSLGSEIRADQPE